MLGGEVIDYGPGQSMLTTVDLPVVAHVTQASAREPFLGMMLTLEVHTIVQWRPKSNRHQCERAKAIGRSRSRPSNFFAR